MALALVSIIVFIFSLIFGYTKSKSALWFVVFTYPLLYPANFPIVPSELIYLNITRVSFAIVLGSHLKNARKFQLSKIFESSFIKAYLFFAVLLAFISFSDMAKFTIFSLIPEFYISISLGYFLIQKESDFKRLIRILTWHGLIFGIIIYLDFFQIVNIQIFIAKLVPNFNMSHQEIDGIRAGIRRVSGFDGNSVNSAVRLAVLFPISILQIKFTNKKRYYIFPIVILLSILILFSRSAYISLLLGMIFVLFQILNFRKKILSKLITIFKISLFALTISMTLFVVSPFINNIISSLYSFSIDGDTIDNLGQRLIMLPVVYEMIFSNSFFGVFMSPLYVYEKVLGGHDLPSPLMYVISGGIPLMLLFFNWWIRMPFYFLKNLNFREKPKEFKLILILISSSFVVGIIPMLSNWIDTHISLMIIIFCATYKYNMLRKKTKQINY